MARHWQIESAGAHSGGRNNGDGVTRGVDNSCLLIRGIDLEMVIDGLQIAATEARSFRARRERGQNRSVVLCLRARTSEFSIMRRSLHSSFSAGIEQIPYR